MRGCAPISGVRCPPRGASPAPPAGIPCGSLAREHPHRRIVRRQMGGIPAAGARLRVAWSGSCGLLHWSTVGRRGQK